MAKSSLALGLMSGTSADGITAALVSLTGRTARVLRWRTWPYPPALRRRVLAAAGMTAPELSRLNFELGSAFARAARSLGGPRPSVIGSHGQTVWHGPGQSPPNTLQLGEPAVIAERTGIRVVADFRPRDMAAGGEGAPLVPAFDEFLFGGGPPRALQNIGGIANVAVVGRGGLKTAFDTGPGNCLLDLAASLATNGRLTMDRGGKLAAKGWADLRLVNRMLKTPYLQRKPPKSLDRSSFDREFLKKHFGRVASSTLPDVLATLTLFTARSIADSYRRFVLPRWKVTEVVVSGGGALNPSLMRELKLILAPLPVVTAEARGIPFMAKEAACFAWLAWRAVNGLPNNCPRATGARGPRILGKIIPA